MTEVIKDTDSANLTGEPSTPQAVKKKDKKKPVKKDAKPNKEDVKEKKTAKQISKIKEQLQRRREEEERKRREEEEEERRLEEQRRKEEEEEAKERERRERRKQKEKERKQRLKEEGKLLSEKQKEDKRKVLELLQARGVEFPAELEKKKPLYGKLKKRPTVIKTTTTNGESVPEEPQPIISEDVDDLPSWEDLANTEESEQSVENVEANTEPEDYSEKPSCPVEHYSHNEGILSEEEKKNLIEAAQLKIQEKHERYESNRSEQHLRAGVICVLGHVDTGKTKILDKLRNTNVQDREAGGITQQIGATNVPYENIKKATQMCDYFSIDDLRLPGLLIIDTPGHESFTNLRVRGSSLCDIAILVVDLMHSLEEQTKESIRILKARKTPFVVALNKIDRLYGFKSNPSLDVKTVLAAQELMAKNDFDDHYKKVVQDFAMMEINVKLFYDTTTPDEFVNMVPTSAHTGDGMGDLLAVICSQLQNTLSKRLAYSEELQASIMEVKEIHGLGTTVDVIVVNGRIRESDTIVLAGQDGAIATQVRGLLQPAPMSELRVKGTYQHMKEIKGAQGVKLIAKDLEKALAGLPLYVATDLGEELFYKEEVCRGLNEALKAISVSPVGVYVVASTLGSLESLLVYLKSVTIPVSGINIGTVHKKDVMKASVMVEREPKWAVILAFDVKVDKDAQKLAAESNVRIFTSDIIYRLQTQMEEYIEDLKRGYKRKHRDLAVFPCKLRILPDNVFHKRAPIVIGVHVEGGVVREGTPICVPSRDQVHLGRVHSLRINDKDVQEARTGQEVCIRIDPLDGETPKAYDRHFDHNDLLVSKISRESIDVMKEYFRSDLTKEDWKLMVELKKLLDIY